MGEHQDPHPGAGQWRHAECDNTRVESRECVSVPQSSTASVATGNSINNNNNASVSSILGDYKNDGKDKFTWKSENNRWRKKKKKKKKHRRGRKKNRRRKKGGRRRNNNYNNNVGFANESSPECVYEAAVWSECDPDTGLQTTTQTLGGNSDSEKCEKTVVMNRRC